ncbi:Pectate trisaccharide-lyase precursor [Pseudobythopirellula maris]|uniref:Probable pectate lyase C n=1 Tax=Pseudobythopirellula maris TaxID=2527991 RepID=A0A5C5ZTJ3_9BACT|nr:pectin esterase [Pseudobythopirellula maris]TWT90864.1 Pectate trisaccharide-lyase precursor [Pseudobythopirellula maris]
MRFLRVWCSCASGVLLLLGLAACLQAAPHQPTGFASVAALGLSGTTGGAGGAVVIAENESQLAGYLAGDTPRVVAVRGSIEISDFGREIPIGSNKTVIGLGDDAEIVYGGFRIISESNVIVRNLTIRDSYVEGDDDGKTQDYDGIQVDNSHHIWIDHVHLTRMGDGLIDLRGAGLDYVTISNSILSEHNKALGVGWTDDTNQKVTIHHTWIHDTHQRNPAFDNVIGHFYNNLLEDISSYGLNPRGSAQVVSENNIFDNVIRGYLVEDNAQFVANGDVLINSGSPLRPRGTPFSPSDYYDYTLDPTDTLREQIMANSGPQTSVGVLPIAGDYNADGSVDAADFTVWRDRLGEPAGALPNDASGQPIGDPQLQVWRDNFGQNQELILASASSAVPEPGALGLVWCGALLSVFRVRRAPRRRE